MTKKMFSKLAAAAKASGIEALSQAFTTPRERMAEKARERRPVTQKRPVAEWMNEQAQAAAQCHEIITEAIVETIQELRIQDHYERVTAAREPREAVVDQPWSCSSPAELVDVAEPARPAIVGATDRSFTARELAQRIRVAERRHARSPFGKRGQAILAQWKDELIAELAR